jgi:hypothetical protein
MFIGPAFISGPEMLLSCTPKFLFLLQFLQGSSQSVPINCCMCPPFFNRLSNIIRSY